MAGDDSSAARGDSPRPQRTFLDLVMAHDVGDMMGVLNTEPCAREGLMYGLGSGIGASVLGFFKRGSFISAGNWGIASFLVVAVVAKQLCHFQRAHQHAKMRTLLGQDIIKPATPAAVKGFQPHAPTDSPAATAEKSTAAGQGPRK